MLSLWFNFCLLKVKSAQASLIRCFNGTEKRLAWLTAWLPQRNRTLAAAFQAGSCVSEDCLHHKEKFWDVPRFNIQNAWVTSPADILFSVPSYSSNLRVTGLLSFSLLLSPLGLAGYISCHASILSVAFNCHFNLWCAGVGSRWLMKVCIALPMSCSVTWHW